MVEQGFIAEARLSPDPERRSGSTRRSRSYGGTRPRSTRSPRTRDDRDPLPVEFDQERVTTLEAVLRLVAPSIGPDHLRRLAATTSSSSRSRCSATRSTRSIRASSTRPASPARASAPHVLRPRLRHYGQTMAEATASMTLGWTGPLGRAQGQAGQGLHRCHPRGRCSGSTSGSSSPTRRIRRRRTPS